MESSVFYLADTYEDDSEIYLFTNPSELFSVQRNDASCGSIWAPLAPPRGIIKSNKKPNYPNHRKQHRVRFILPIKIHSGISSGIYQQSDVEHGTETSYVGEAIPYRKAIHYFKNLKGKKRLLYNQHNACLLAGSKANCRTKHKVFVLVEALTEWKFIYKLLYQKSFDYDVRLPLLDNIKEVRYNRSKVTDYSIVVALELNTINAILSAVNIDDIITILKTLKVLMNLAKDPVNNRLEDAHKILYSLVRLILESKYPTMVKVVASILYRIISHKPIKDVIIRRRYFDLIHVMLLIISGQLRMISEIPMKCRSKIASLLVKMTANHDLKFCGFFLKYYDLFPLNSVLLKEGLHHIKKKILIILNNLLRHPDGYSVITHSHFFSFIPFLKCLWTSKKPSLRQAAFLVLDSILRISRAMPSHFNHKDFMDEFGLNILLELLEDVANIDRKLSLQAFKLLSDLSESHLGCQRILQLGIHIISSIAFYRNPDHLAKIIGRSRYSKRNKKRVVKRTDKKIISTPGSSKSKIGLKSEISIKEKRIKKLMISLYDELQLYSDSHTPIEPYLYPDVLKRPFKRIINETKQENASVLTKELDRSILIHSTPDILLIQENLTELKEEKSNRFEMMGYTQVPRGEHIKWDLCKRDSSNQNLTKPRRGMSNIVMEVSRLRTLTPFKKLKEEIKDKFGASSGKLSTASSYITSEYLDEEHNIVCMKSSSYILPENVLSGQGLGLADVIRHRVKDIIESYLWKEIDRKVLKRLERNLEFLKYSLTDHLTRFNLSNIVLKTVNRIASRLFEDVNCLETVERIVNHVLKSLDKESHRPEATCYRSLSESETSSDSFIAASSLNKKKAIEYQEFDQLPPPFADAVQSSREAFVTRNLEWRSSSSDEIDGRSDEYIYKHKLLKREQTIKSNQFLEERVTNRQTGKRNTKKIEMSHKNTVERREMRRKIRLDVKRLQREKANSESACPLGVDHLMRCAVLPPTSDEFGNLIEYYKYPPQIFNSTRQAAVMLLCKIINDAASVNAVAGVVKMVCPLILVKSYAKTAAICLENIIGQNRQALAAVRDFDLLSYLVEATNRTSYPMQTRDRLMGVLTALLRWTSQQCHSIRTKDIRINIISWLGLVDPDRYDKGCVFNLRNICCIARVHPSRDYVISRQTMTRLLSIMMDRTLRESYRIHACVAFSSLLFAKKKYRKVKFYDKNKSFYRDVEMDPMVFVKTMNSSTDTEEESEDEGSDEEESEPDEEESKSGTLTDEGQSSKTESSSISAGISPKTSSETLLNQKQSLIVTLQQCIDSDLFYPSMNTEHHSSYQLFLSCTLLLFMRRYPYQACIFLSRNYKTWYTKICNSKS